MGSRRAPRPRRRRGRWLGVAVALVAALAAVWVGVQLRPADNRTAPAPRPTGSPPPVRNVDLSALPIRRGPFCTLLDDTSLTTALGAEVSRTAHYDNGDRAQLVPGVTDVSHEYNCSFYAASGAQARAWVFAEPVRRRQARALAREGAKAPGCRLVDGEATFGRPTSTKACLRQGAAEVTMRGLFGDAWFSCQLTVPGQAGVSRSVRRTERWCVHVAETVGARP